ncbi:hypothetical protein EON00_18840 [Burkholderia sp. ISTR5]|nr:hypothetical protein [Burkholderia sp. ISTR5]
MIHVSVSFRSEDGTAFRVNAVVTTQRAILPCGKSAPTPLPLLYRYSDFLPLGRRAEVRSWVQLNHARRAPTSSRCRARISLAQPGEISPDRHTPAIAADHHRRFCQNRSRATEPRIVSKACRLLRFFLTILETSCRRLLHWNHNRQGLLRVGRIFFRGTGTIWQNAEALKFRRCSQGVAARFLCRTNVILRAMYDLSSSSGSQ